MRNNIFFDANIWIDYCWRKYFSKNRGRKKKPAILIHNLHKSKTRVILTAPLLYEVCSHFKDYFLLQDAIYDGFSTFEFNRVKKNYTLRKTSKIEVDKIYTDISSLKITRDGFLPDWINDKTIESVFKLTNRYDLEFLDAMHLIASSISKCKVFVSKDEILLKRGREISKHNSNFKNIDFVSPETFNSKYPPY